MPRTWATYWSLCLYPAEPVVGQVRLWYQEQAKLVAEANYRSPTSATVLRYLPDLVSPTRFRQFARRACHSFSCWTDPQEVPAEAPHPQILRVVAQSAAFPRCFPVNLAAGPLNRCSR